jgi:predicted PurR-regulated permease PerM
VTEPGGRNEGPGPRGGGGDDPRGDAQQGRHRRNRRRRHGNHQAGGGGQGSQPWGQRPSPQSGPGFQRPLLASRRQNLPALLALLLCVAILLIGAVAIFLPFAAPIVLALVLTTASYSVFDWILRWVGEKRRGLAAAMTCSLVVLVVFVPLAWITYAIVSEAPSKDDLDETREHIEKWFAENKTIKDLSSWVNSLQRESKNGTNPSVQSPDPNSKPATNAVESGTAAREQHAQNGDVADKPEESVAAKNESPRKPAETGASKESRAKDGDSRLVESAIGWAARSLQALLTIIVSNTLLIVLNFFLMLFIYFFFLKDGPIILQAVMRQVPLEKSYQEKVVSTFVQVSRSVVRGSFGTAFFQGAVAAVAYAIVGFSAVFWGVLTAFCALIPVVGSTIITVPIAIYLYFKASLWKCIVVVVMAVVIGTLDNFLKPMLMRGSLRIHSIWLMLSILGGISAFGPMGLLYGPMVLTLLGTFLAIFLREEQAEAAREDRMLRDPGAQRSVAAAPEAVKPAAPVLEVPGESP